MQTTKWGPDGWKLLHLITFNHPGGSSKSLKCFTIHVGDVLPCIYCRNSYREFTSELPIEDFDDPFEWLYLIHNKVNHKLRKQGYLDEPDPNYGDIVRKYTQLSKKVSPSRFTIGWDFLYAIIFNYPIKPCPVDKYNYRMFFRILRDFYPHLKIKKLYTKYYNSDPIDRHLKSRISLKSWFYRLHRSIFRELGKNVPSYEEVCNKYEDMRASCGVKSTNSCRIKESSK